MPHGCHDWPIKNSTSQMTCETSEFISGDTEMSNSRDSYRVNSEWFSSTLARASSAPGSPPHHVHTSWFKGWALHMEEAGLALLELGGSKAVLQKTQEVADAALLHRNGPGCQAVPCARFASSTTAISRHTGFFRSLRKRTMVLYNFSRRLKGGVASIRSTLLSWMLSLLRVSKTNL